MPGSVSLKSHQTGLQLCAVSAFFPNYDGHVEFTSNIPYHMCTTEVKIGFSYCTHCCGSTDIL